MCEQLHRCSVPHYRLIHKNEILMECKRGGSGKVANLCHKEANSHAESLLVEIRKYFTGKL